MSDAMLESALRKGGLFRDIPGTTAEDVLSAVCDAVPLPEGLSRDTLWTALCDREKMNSTAVGNGIAIPHSKVPLVKSDDEQRIAICYLREPLDMKALDKRKVFVMFLILSSNMHYHQVMLVKLANLFKQAEFRKLLEAREDLDELLTYVKWRF